MQMDSQKMKSEAELNQFLRWWSVAGDVFAAFARKEEIDAVQGAFARVLFKIPEKSFSKFIEFAPHLFCCPRAEAATWRFRVKVRAGTEYADLRIIYLPPDFNEYTDERLDFAIAHEVAHVILDHNPSRYKTYMPEAERDVAALLKEWGFTEPKESVEE